jgi:hypothetical protein
MAEEDNIKIERTERDKYRWYCVLGAKSGQRECLKDRGFQKGTFYERLLSCGAQPLRAEFNGLLLATGRRCTFR